MGEWREATREDIKAFFENGLGKIERIRIYRCAEDLLTPTNHPVSRGKGKKRKKWEGRYGY